MRILGIDPGTGICGFGVIDGTIALDYGVISTPPHTPLEVFWCLSLYGITAKELHYIKGGPIHACC